MPLRGWNGLVSHDPVALTCTVRSRLSATLMVPEPSRVPCVRSLSVM